MKIGKMTKILTAAFIAGTAALAPSRAGADTWTDDDGYVWTYSTNDVSATVTGVSPVEYDMTIPATLGGKPVVAFGTVFKGKSAISEIVIPDSVTAIADSAFNGCSQLQRVTFGAGIKRIGSYAFRNCSLLQKAELPEATTELGIGAFSYCEKLTTAKLPGVTVIPGSDDGYSPSSTYYFKGYGAFYGCDKLRTVELGAGLTTIGNGAFYDCNELYDLVIPDAVTNIGSYAFAECDKLHSVAFGRGVESVRSAAFLNCAELENIAFHDDSVRTLASSAFSGCKNLQSLKLPAGLTKIGVNCFAHCENIPEVVIPDSVTSLTNGAFAYCTALANVKLGIGIGIVPGADVGSTPGNTYGFQGEGVFYGCTALTNAALNSTLKTIGNGAFYGCSALPAISIPDSVRTVGNYAFAECGLLRDVLVGDGVRLIGRYAFYNANKLETLVLGAKTQTIEESAFRNCSALKSFSIPDTVLTIGTNCFKSCTSLTTLTLPDSVGVIGPGAFASCTRLSTVVIGDGLEEISGAEDAYTPNSTYNFHGYGAFYGCSGLTSVTIGSSVATIGNGAFYNCKALPSIVIPSSVSTIGNYAFVSNTALVSVEIADGGVTSIGKSAFYDCTSLASAALGNRLVTIGDHAFNGCIRLTGLTLPDTLITLDGWSFKGCRALKSIVIPDKVKDLNAGAFAYCTGLERVKIGKTLQVVGGAEDAYAPNSTYNFHGYGAFYGCTALTDVDLGTTLSEISTGAFYGCTALEAIAVPDSVTKIGGYAFAACTSLIKAAIGAGVATMGDGVFNGDTALHYVEFTGEAAPANTGSGIFKDTTSRTMVYVAEGSTGWTGLYQPGLPDVWQDKAITYAPPPEGADNPYDFYPFVRTDRVSGVNYPWSLIVTTNRYVSGNTKPLVPAQIYDDETLYLSYCMNEFWRGEAFVVTNEFALTGAREGSFVRSFSSAAHSTVSHWLTTNATPEVLQGLPVGEYTLSLALNADGRLAETDGANNATSITFRVVTAPSFTVTFNPNGGTLVTTKRQVKRNTAVGSLPKPTREGYTFLGWFTSSSGGTQVLSGTKVVKPSVTYYAHWSLNSYTVTFDANGGAVAEGSRTVSHGKSVGTLPNVSARYGYAFAGWFTAKEGGTKISSSTKVTGAVTFYAQWTVKHFSVVLSKNDGTGATYTQIVEYGNATNLPGAAAALKWAPRRGFKFMGWAESEKSKTVYLADKAALSRNLAVGETKTVYAIWQLDAATAYAIQYIRNDGSGAVRTIGFIGGAATKLNSVAALGFARRGYTFGGWAVSTANARAKKVWKPDMGTVSQPVANGKLLQIYAIWTLADGYYSIRFNKNDGSGKWRELGYEYGKNTTLPTIQNGLGWTREGYEFAGWGTSATSTAAWRGDAGVTKTPVAAGKTLSIYAIWKPVAAKAAAKSPAIAPHLGALGDRALPAALEPGFYTGPLADGTGVYSLLLDPAADGCASAAFLVLSTANGETAVECTAETSGGVLVLTTDDGQTVIVSADGVATVL